MTPFDRSTRDIPRRQFVTIGAGAFVLASLPLAIARTRRSRDAALTRRTVPVMGTFAELAVAGLAPAEAHAALDAAVAELRWVEATMTRFSPHSDIGRANRLAARAAVPVADATAEVVREALAWAGSTNGRYDPAIGSVVALWDVTHRTAPPPEERRARLAGRSLHRHVEVDTRGGAPAIRLHDADAQLDLGSIAKGYAVDRAADALRAHGVRHGLVDVGGDLHAVGTAPTGDPWRIGVRDPEDPRRMRAILDVADEAVATSGTYEQFFRHRGERYHHLLDPATAAPRRVATESLTIVAARCMHADVAATALFGCDATEARRVLAARAPGAYVAMTA